MKNTLTTLTAALALVALAGCAAVEPQTTPTPTAPATTPAADGHACEQFNTALADVAIYSFAREYGAFTGDPNLPVVENWVNMHAALDAATPDVATEMGKMKNLMPDAYGYDLFFRGKVSNGADFQLAINGIAQRCDALGYPLIG